MRIEMHDRIPAIGHGEAVAGDGLAAAIGVHHLDRLQAEMPLRTGDVAITDHLRADGLGRPAQLGRHRCAGIDHGHHLSARRGDIGHGAPAVIARGEDCDGPAREHAVSVEVGPHRAGQHHAGPVVAAEDVRALDGSGSENGLLCRDPPQALARRMDGGHGEMIADALDRPVGSVIVDPEQGGPAQNAHLRHARQFGEGVRGPSPHRIGRRSRAGRQAGARPSGDPRRRG